MFSPISPVNPATGKSALSFIAENVMSEAARHRSQRLAQDEIASGPPDEEQAVSGDLRPCRLVLPERSQARPVFLHLTKTPYG
jgi:hypothetical protein